MKKFMVLVLIIILVFSGCSKEKPELMVFAGAGLKGPLEELARGFENESGIKVLFNFAGSGQHLSQMEVGTDGDVFISGSEYHARIANEKKLIEDFIPIAYHRPAFVIGEEAAKSVKSFEDISEGQFIIGFGDKEATAIGKISPNIFDNLGLAEVLKDSDIVYTSTVNELLTHVNMGTVDIAVVWEDLARTSEGLKVLEIPKELNIIDIIPGALIKSSTHKNEGKEFLEYVVSEQGESILNKYGFDLVKNE